jgi:hypothetical protein
MLVCKYINIILAVLLPADGTLTVRRAFSDAERLSDLCLRQSQGQSSKLEGFCKFLDLIQIDPIHNIAVGLVDGWLICEDKTQKLLLLECTMLYSTQFVYLHC